MTAAIKSLALAMTVGLVVASASSGQAPQRKRGAAAEDQVRQALAKAHELREKFRQLKDLDAREAIEEEFSRTVREVRASFPEVPAVTGDRARFVKVSLNSRGAAFDAVRFRTPSVGQDYQLFWDYVIPGHRDTINLQEWNILPVEGESLMFANHSRREDVTVPVGLGMPAENFAVSAYLYGKKLRAGTEYILWFNLKDDRPLPTLAKVRIEPIAPVEPPTTPALVKARSTYQEALEALNERYDGDVKAHRKRYLAELEKGARLAASRKDVREVGRIIAEADLANGGVSDAGDPRGLRVIRAEYGVDDRWTDVTIWLRGLIKGDVMVYDPDTVGFPSDPAFGHRKRLFIVYTRDGKPDVSITWADQKVQLPPATPAKESTPAKK